MSDQNENEPLQKNFFIRVGFIFVVIVALYFLMSPYQNCVRDNPKTRGCVQVTSW